MRIDFFAMSVRAYLVGSGEPKDFAHDIDAAEWAAAGLVTFEAPKGKSEPKPEPKPEPVKEVPVQASEEFAAPGIVEEAPKKRAPRRRSAE